MAKEKILVVDDQAELLDITKTTLEGAGYEAITADGGMKAVELAKKHKPALILLDVMMPEVDGLMALAILKKDAKTASIPVVLLTNLPEEAGQKQAEELGAIAYLLKVDHDPDQLVAKVKKFLKK